jgi:hypothetical protein
MRRNHDGTRADYWLNVTLWIALPIVFWSTVAGLVVWILGV